MKAQKKTYYSVVLFAALLLAGYMFHDNVETVKYITWEGLEPDKWASVWLIKKRIAPGAVVLIRPIGAPTDDGVAFGVPTAKYRRRHGVVTFESLLREFDITEPALHHLGQIIHDIEINSWGEDKVKQSIDVEQAFRVLQDSFEDRNVPVACYERFFDMTYKLLNNPDPDGNWKSLYSLSDASEACRVTQSELAVRDKMPYVQRVQIHRVLNYIAAGKTVMFVDAREAEEFEEYHIPGAINLTLRDVNKNTASRFLKADMVIGYCIKDFRGYEMARSLARVGVENTAIMIPYGIAGWRSLGLPTTGINDLSEDEALYKLELCARGQVECG